ncbi:hypothetical protein DE146DRAFT_341083 [Phaeosphaeria sp. MPI-PUGE-AT-0046c]|nr:hypothetical protein DE146DRAFT_341083 [Phaeosphaeria sp. MPI-PUGE-AT-0046c]
MWSRFTGKSDNGSPASKDEKEESRRRSTRVKRDSNSDLRSVVSSTSTRKPARRDTAPSSIASFATAFDDVPRTRANDDLYEDPREDRFGSSRDDRRSSYAESSVSTTRRDEKDRKKSRDTGKDKKSDKRRSTRSERSGSQSQVGGYRGDIVESPRQPTRSFSGQIASDGFSQFPGQAGAPLMSGALPSPHPSSSKPGMSSHVQDQFPGQDPSKFASSALPGGNPFGAAADYYRDQGESVDQQPGVRTDAPSVIIGQDTPHLTAASAQPNPVADTGSGAAADFYISSTNTNPSKPPRPSSMPGAFFDDEPAPPKPPRPSSKPAKPAKPSKFGSAATLAGGAALGYAMGHGSSNEHQSTSYSASNTYSSTSHTNGISGHSTSVNNQGQNPSYTATNGSSYIPTYSQAMEDAPPPKPPRPGKPEKHSSGSNAGLYAAAGAAGLAAYGLHHHNSHSEAHTHSHNHNTSTPGAFPGQNYNGSNIYNSNLQAAGGMAQRHQHTGPVSRFVDWWKDYEDVQKMEEYTEYIGVCKYCFDPRSSVTDAPRKHHYHRRRSSEYMRPSGGIEKHSRYSLKEKKSHSSFSSGDERRKKHGSSNAAGWVAAGLGGIGLAKAGKAVLGARRDDFDDTYSIKSGRDHRSRISGRSRSRSRDRKQYDYSYGQSEVRRRSRSRDRISLMSTGVTKDKKDYKIRRRRSRSHSRSSSSSRDGKSGFGKVLGAGIAGAALGAAVHKRRKSRSRSRSPKKSVVFHRQDGSDDERRRRKSQQLRRKSSRSSASGASVIDISQNQSSQGGFLGGFFAAPPPKIKRKKSITASRKKKGKGFFNFGNASSSSSDSEMAFGTGYVQRRRRSSPKRRNSDERLKATLAGLGATAAAIAAAKAARSGKHHGEVVAVKEHRNQRKSNNRPRPRPGSRYGDDEWEDLPDDDTSESSSDAGLVYGDHDWRKGKSQESLVSNGSGTNKWGWRWGFGQKKRRSSDNLYTNIANTSLIGPAAAGATAAAVVGVVNQSKLGRHDSESSSVQTLQTVYPVASNDPTTFDARRTSSIPTPQPLITSGPGIISLQQPQPIQQVPGSLYSSQAPSQANYAAPSGPPVFSQLPGQFPYPTQFQTQNVTVQAAQPAIHPPLPRRANSSPIQTSSWKRDAAIAGLAATAGAAAIAAAKSKDRTPSSPSNVRFDLTKEQTDKDERDRRKAQSLRDDEDRRRREQQMREEDKRREEEARHREEQQRRDEEARRAEDDRRREELRRDDERQREEERRRHELLRQHEEARKYMEAERLAKVEAEHRADERRRQQDELRAREARDAEERSRREHEARAESQRRADAEAEAEQIRRERLEAERREAARIEAKGRDDRTRDRDSQQHSNRNSNDRVQPKLEEQRTGTSVSSVASDVRRKEKELERRERDIMQPDTSKSTLASAVAAGAAATIASAAISSYKGKEKEKSSNHRSRDSFSTVKNVTPSTKAYESSRVSTVEPSGVVTYAPSNLQQDYGDDEIFDPNFFKKQTTKEVFKDWEDRYNGPKVTQADFFAPKELLQNDNLPKARPIDPNEGATNITMSEAHDDTVGSHSMTPPYPTAYSFVATRDGRPSHQQSWPVPSLNLIAPTPPGSRAPSLRAPSPAPVVEPAKEPEPAKPEETNRARSRVSWGENQFHHFEVPTPDSYREQFVSDSDLNAQEKESRDDNSARQTTSISDQPATSYQAYRPPQTGQVPESSTAASTQYVRGNEKESDWDSIVDASSKKSNKKEKKKAKAAAAAAAAAASAAAATSSATRDADDWDEWKRENSSMISNPFSDSHVAASVIAPSTVGSSIPSSSSVYQPPSYDSASDLDLSKGPGRSTNGPGFVKDETNANPHPMHVPGSFDEPAVTERVADKPAHEDPVVSSIDIKKGKNKLRSTDDTVAAYDTSKREDPVGHTEPQLPKEVSPEPEIQLSKKEKKKRSKAAKRASIDSWEQSDVSPPTSPTIERDIRDIEPVTTGTKSRSESTSNNAVAAAMAGGFAALLGNSMKQDQERIASDFEHARESFQSTEKHNLRDASSSGQNGTSAYDTNDRISPMPGTSFDEDDLVEAKTPRRKKEKRHSSGRWSPSIGSPLRTETRYEDYMGPAPPPPSFEQQPLVEAPKIPTGSALTNPSGIFNSRNVNDSGYHAPDDVPRKENADRDSDEFFSAGSDEREQSKKKASEPTQSPGIYEEADKSTVVSPRSKYDDEQRSVDLSRNKYEDEADREERHRHRDEAKSESRDQSRDRSYGLEDGSERRRRHRRRETEDPSDDWDTRSTISEARSDATGERRRKHRRRESERDGSVESMTRSRSSAVSEIGDLHDDRKSSRRKSRRDDDDNASVISSSSRHDDDRSSKKEKEKRSSGLFSLLSRSKENLVEPSSKSSKSRDDDEEEEGKRRRRKHRSDRGSTYGSDDDDTRSTISTSSRREKRSSRSERGEGDRKEAYEEKVHRSSYAR